MEGTSRAESLLESWNQRQQELKEAMAEMVKPVEHMANITAQLQSPDISHHEMEMLLVELESNLGDIDNARDFHTIGGWSVLSSFLSSHWYVCDS